MADPKHPHISDKDRAAGEHEAAREVAKEAAKQKFKADTATTSDAEPKRQYPGSDEISLWAPLLDLGPDELLARIDDKEHPVPEEKVFGLLALERNGQNRTPYVKGMMDRLGLKVEDLPGGGPGYTNDVTPVTKL